jgi:hypothetical protein
LTGPSCAPRSATALPPPLLPNRSSTCPPAPAPGGPGLSPSRDRPVRTQPRKPRNCATGPPGAATASTTASCQEALLHVHLPTNSPGPGPVRSRTST